MNRDEFYIALEHNRTYVQEHSDELQHWGIKGMKWGIRRYQNPDGTLTEEGKRHYADKVIPREITKQVNHESYEGTNINKSTRAVGTALGGFMGVMPGAVEGGITLGPLGAIGGAIAGAFAGGFLGKKLADLSIKVTDNRYEKSKKRIDEIIKKHGNEKVDGEKIKSLVKSYKNALEDYYKSEEYNQSQIDRQQELHEAHTHFMNQVQIHNNMRMMGMM